MSKTSLSGQVREQYKDTASGRINGAQGIYLGIVKKNTDEQNMGRLWVWIPEFKGDPEDESGWKAVNYCSPFAGATDPYLQGTNPREYNDTQKAYGFWAVPPDLNNEVIVAFYSGDLSKGVWLGNLYQKASNYTVPGIAYGKTYGQVDKEFYPSAEKNKKDPDNDETLRPKHTPLGQALNQQGLLGDLERGAGTSSSHRESPSRVTGLLTPGQHQLVLDDGDASGGNKLIRIRTAGGAQILIDDTFGFMYFINRDGTAWMELNQEGHVDVYASQGINLNASGDFNIRAGGAVNIEAAGNINMKATNVNMAAVSTTNISSNSNTLISSGANTEIGSAGQHIETAQAIHMNGPSAAAAEQPKINQLPVNKIVRKSVLSRIPEHEPWRGHAVSATSLAAGQSSQSAANDDGSTGTPATTSEDSKPVDVSDVTPTENVDPIKCIPLKELSVSKNIVDYIIAKERWRPVEYWDFRSNSIGFGHLQDGKSYDRAGEFDDGQDWDQAYAKFLQDVQSFEKSVRSAFKALPCMTQPQFDALVSASYNMGPGNLLKLSASGSGIVDLATAGKWTDVAACLTNYKHETGRRNEEAVILLKGYYPPSNKNKDALIAEGLKAAKNWIDNNRAQIKGEAIDGRPGAYKPIFGPPTERQKKQWAAIKLKYAVT